MLKVQEEGYLLWPLLKLPNDFKYYNIDWNRFYDYMRNKQSLDNIPHFKLLISVIMYEKDDHMMAVEADFISNRITVSDPPLDKLFYYTWDEFMKKYEKIYEIMWLESGESEDYPIIPPPNV
jgi:hypothetical protein